MVSQPKRPGGPPPTPQQSAQKKPELDGNERLEFDKVLSYPALFPMHSFQGNLRHHGKLTSYQPGGKAKEGRDNQSQIEEVASSTEQIRSSDQEGVRNPDASLENMWSGPLRPYALFDVRYRGPDTLGRIGWERLASRKRELVKNACYTHGYLVGAAISLIPLVWLHEDPGAMNQILAKLTEDMTFVSGAAFASTTVGLSFDKLLKKLRRLWHSEKLSSYREKALAAIEKTNKLFVAAWLVQGAMWSKETEWQLYSLCLNPKELIFTSNADIFIDVAVAQSRMLAIKDHVLDERLRAMWPMPVVYDDASDSN
ncbi:hypothetical protein OOU_Y34scaffold00711g30 [Pyricularia oryzae Y34]|nr:hypothetical protein OOU_Y34scaffold00711g30 [Pyricularia oryzae Y34]